jgi:tripartite-type tricarboxylate transporter receptor subunit TctC
MKTFRIGKVVFVCFVVSLLCAGTFSSQAFADYPNRPIKLVVAFAPGGGGGLAAQILQGYFAKKWNQQINIVYKPGGSSVPGVHEVYTSKPDGYTVLLDGTTMSSLQEVILKSLPYKVEERTFIAQCMYSPNLWYSSPSRPWKTLKDVQEFAKRDPENLKWGSMGNSSVATFNVYLMLESMGVDIPRTKRIDVKSSPELLAGTAGGHIDFSCLGIGPSLPLIDAGKIVPMGVLAKERIKRVHNVPTLIEAGHPRGGINYWMGISGPPGVPKEVIEKWNITMGEAATDPEFINTAEKSLYFPDYLPSEAYKTAVMDEIKVLRGVAQKIGLAAR